MQGEAKLDTSRFAEIRPYNDEEVRPVLDRLLRNPELVRALLKMKFPGIGALAAGLVQPLFAWLLRRRMARVRDVHGFQCEVERYMRHMIGSTTTAFTVSGLERLEPDRAHLFISNHRDIALDPAFVNYALFTNGQDTVRIAIGDNLLTKDYASDLMRLNKSFIVRRAKKGPRQMLAVYRELSEYIQYSVVSENRPVWIAQREGRAKDGWDRTEEAMIKMLAICKPKEREFAAHMRELNIVPVSISYEWDPCDTAKARELFLRETTGSYEKAPHEDVQSIAKSITSPKGAVHVSFGTQLRADFGSAALLAEEVDRQVVSMYSVHASNLAAYRMQEGRLPAGIAPDGEIDRAAELLEQRLAQLEPGHRPYLLRMYANPILNREALAAAGSSTSAAPAY